MVVNSNQLLMPMLAVILPMMILVDAGSINHQPWLLITQRSLRLCSFCTAQAPAPGAPQFCCRSRKRSQVIMLQLLLRAAKQPITWWMPEASTRRNHGGFGWIWFVESVRLQMMMCFFFLQGKHTHSRQWVVRCC